MIVNSPVKFMLISQPFGFDNSFHKERGSFYSLFDNRHPGVDFDLSENTAIYASFEGIVVRNEYHSGMGNVVGIRSGNIVALYAHLNISKVKRGDVVNTGGLVGFSGNTGAATTAPHLHFELRDISKPNLKEMVFDPLFGKELLSHSSTFVYKVNNKNSIKTLKTLSDLFFGTEEYVDKLKNINRLGVDDDEQLPDELPVTIPNY